MKVNIEEKSKELKELVSQFESSFFLGEISSMIPFISFDKPSQTLEGLTSPLRQLYYIGALNVSSKIDPQIQLRPQFSQTEWDKIKELLNEIDLGYLELFYPEEEHEIDEEWLMKRRVAMPTFLSYFNEGALNYEEQEIERIIEYFTPFNPEIINHFGINVSDFIDIYNFIDSLPNKFLNDKINYKEGQQSWEDFAQSMIEKELLPYEWNEHLPEHFREYFNFMYDKGKMQRFSLTQISEIFGVEKAKSFLLALTSVRQETDFLYYTESNILQTRPIFKLSDSEFQCIETKLLIHSIYNSLFGFCVTNPLLKEKFYAIRGNKLEDKLEDIFQVYFNNKAIVYKGYYTTDGHEQDLLFLIDNIALIIEAKASKRDEPRRNPNMAFPLILSNFEEVIQKGYDQTYRVKSKFIERQPLKLYSNQQLTKQIAEINTSKYNHVFSLIVTQERFGQLQIDLSELLEIWDNDDFPWSICIDDLEIFLLAMKKMKMKRSDFVDFLHIRKKIHGKLICSDELEVCGAYLNKILTHKVALSDNILALTPDLSNIFDNFYQKGGLGFKNEKNMELKNNNKFHIIGK